MNGERTRAACLADALRLTPDEARYLKDIAQRDYEACSHADPRVGRERYRSIIDAINALEERR